jgi:hypothetical protein
MVALLHHASAGAMPELSQNSLTYCLLDFLYKLAQSVLCIHRHQMICTIRSGLLDPFDSMELVILGMTNADLVRSKLMTRSDVCTTIRKI